MVAQALAAAQHERRASARRQHVQGPLEAPPQLRRIEVSIGWRSVRTADLVDHEQRRRPPPHRAPSNLADRAAAHGGVEVVPEVAHHAACPILPDAHEYSLDGVFGGVATAQIGGDVATQRVVMGAEYRLERRLVSDPDAGYEIMRGRV